MNAKTYLKQTFLLDQKINAAQREVAQLRILSTSIQSPRLSKDNIKASGEKRKVEDIINKIICIEEQINNDIDKFVDLKEEIKTKIGLVDNDRLRLVLYKRYITLQKWEDIADDLGIEYRSATRLHGEALIKFANVL